MKKVVFSLIVLALSSGTFSFAQDDSTSYWSKDGSYNLAFTRVNLQNWAGGGQSSVSFSSLLKLHALYSKDKISWDNSLDIGYGIARVGGKNSLFKKSDDQLILVSKFGYQFKKELSFSGLIDYRSQIANGFEYIPDTNEVSGERPNLISRFMAPGYLLTSAGIEFKKDEMFYLVASPITGKMTFVLEESLSAAGAFGVEPGKNFRAELGTLVKTGFKKELMKNVELNTNLILFSAYDTYGNIDVNWDLTLQFKVNDYLTTTFSSLLIYDDDIDVLREDGTTGPAIQFKDVLNIGFLYKF